MWCIDYYSEVRKQLQLTHNTMLLIKGRGLGLNKLHNKCHTRHIFSPAFLKGYLLIWFLFKLYNLSTNLSQLHVLGSQLLILING